MSTSADEHAKSLYQDLINTMMQGKSPIVARRELEDAQERLFGRYPLVLEERLVALKQAYKRFLEEQNKVSYLQKKAVRAGREQWYVGPTEGSLWDKLKRRLTDEGRSGDQIGLVDRDSTTVVGLLDNPGSASFSTRGLVVGHVQSGKTGNMAAVITKAAETPFKFFLVLSGITDQLRNQTQTRLEEDIVNLAPERWYKWTAANTEQVNGDFSEKAIGGFIFDHRLQIAVVKKNAAVLRRFLAKLKNTDEATLRNTPFLIIDDECDQASVNSARYAKAVTRINELIRKIITTLPRCSYVGYTATPFANVLIDTTVPADLYPRHFIHALDRPKGYFGAEDLFGRHALEGEYDEVGDGLDMIRIIESEEVDKIRPPAKGTNVEMVASLEQAIRYYIMVIAARSVRGQASEHNSMLVHTSVLNSVHRATAKVIEPYLKSVVAKLGTGSTELLDTFSREWEAEQERVLSEQFDLRPIQFGELLPRLAEAAGSIRVKVENWSSTDRLDYSGGPHSYLVIGGNVLARGLTLYGLSVSYFLRSSSQYDTLMQMGRWFGYRAGFEDLPRVWVEEPVRDDFYDLATVEAEIRRDIARYAEEELTPEQFAVRIRKIPGMTITAPAKMRAAVPVEVGYSGTHVQTFRFKRYDKTWLDANWQAGAKLLEGEGEVEVRDGCRVLKDVNWERIHAFLLSYQPHDTHKNLAPKFLAEYVRKAGTSMTNMKRWSVVVVGKGNASQMALGPLGKVPTVIRSAEAHTGDNASIKALMSRKDLLLDLGITAPDDASWDTLKALRNANDAPPLLLLYPIEARSEPARASKAGKSPTREPLNAVADVLGLGMVFPGERELSGTYVSANIVPEASEPLDELVGGDRIPDVILEPESGEPAPVS